MAEEKWSWREAVEEARAEVAKKGFPIPKPPEGMSKAYSFPMDVDGLSDPALGKLMLQLTSWHSYTLVQLGWADAEHSALEAIFEMVVGDRVVKAMKELDKKADKASLRASVISADENLRTVFKNLVKLEARVRHYQALADLYISQFNGLSRELSRRHGAASMVR